MLPAGPCACHSLDVGHWQSLSPVCGTSEACTEPSVQVSEWLVSGAPSDRSQSGPEIMDPKRMNK